MEWTSNTLPTVSIVMPIYNEERYIESCLQSLIEQDYPHILEILCVDGGSQDRTHAILAGFLQKYQKIHLLSNPLRVQAEGLNIGIRQAQGEIIARIDAHGLYAQDYITQCVEQLVQTGAGSVGGTATPVAGKSFVSRLIVYAHESRFGIGVAQFRRASEAQWVDTVWPGFYWRRLFDEIGPYRIELARDEDNDFNARIRAHHYGIFLSPKIKAFYFPRRDLKGLCKQSFGNGVGAFPTLCLNPGAVTLRRFIPFAFVVGLLLPLAVAPFHRVGQLIFVALLGLYLLCSIVFAVPIGYQHGARYACIMPGIFFLIHTSYGVGSIWGLMQILRRQVRKYITHGHCNGKRR